MLLRKTGSKYQSMVLNLKETVSGEKYWRETREELGNKWGYMLLRKPGSIQ